ncbi:MAG: alginate lyase family protein [Flavobacteriaceae bacterium]|nr:alginate lyase family protein [Flavobacteriaceae bacterium]
MNTVVSIINSRVNTLKNYRCKILVVCLLLSVPLQAQWTDPSLASQLQVQEVSIDFPSKNDATPLFNQLLKHYQQRQNRYLQLDTKAIRQLSKTHKKEALKTIENADRILKNTFVFRHHWAMERTHIPHTFKEDINWSAKPNGDEEWCYMLNRHRYLIDLGQAYALTGDEKYAEKLVAILSDWILNNPREERFKSISWRRIEAGIRAENWIKGFEYVKNSPHISPQFFELFINSLYQHGVFLAHTFSDFSKTSNWGVIEFQGLFNLSLFLEEFSTATTWRSTALQNLSTCIDLQILADGTQWEQSPMYHNEVFHSYINILLLANRFSIPLPENIVQKTRAMAYANIAWQKPNYKQPMLGDSDDTDIRDFITLAAILFNDPVLKSRGFENIDYESLFIVDARQKKAYQSLHTKPVDFTSIYQESSGDFYMRSSWESNANYASFHLKKLGGGHGHDNLLHFTIFANGRDYLVDPGRYTYIDNAWRKYFKSSVNHNSLEVDGLPNSIYKDSWSNSFEATSGNQFIKTTPLFDYAEASNYAYQRLDDPVTVKRRLLYLKPDVWLLVDSFKAKKAHTYSQHFIFPNDKITINDAGIQTTYQSNNLRIQPLENVDITLRDAWFSSEYNLKTASKKALFSIDKTGSTSLITLLYFPENTKITYKYIPVYSRRDVLIPPADVTAIALTINAKKYQLVIVHQQSAPANTFYKVDGVLVRGEVILIDKNKKTNMITRIK